MVAHKHSIYDTDKHFVIDPVTRGISTECRKLYLMRGDHESERYTFELPRYIEGHDMSICDVVEIHHTNVSSGDVYTVKDLQLSPDSEDVVIFSWLITRSSTQEAGGLEFSVHFKCFDEDWNEVYAWSTDSFTSVKIGKGTNNSKAVVEEHVDAFDQLRQEVNGLSIAASDYNKIANQPIKNVLSDSTNRVALCDLESGVYRLSGSFTPFIGSNRYIWFTHDQLVNVVKKDAGSHVQIFYPIDNTVQFAAIMVDDSEEGGYTYETTNVKLNELKAAVESMNPYPSCLYDPVEQEIIWNTTNKKYIHSLWDETASNYVFIATDEELPETTKGIIDNDKFSTINVEVLKGNSIDTANEYHLVNGIGVLSGASYIGSPYGDFLTYDDKLELQNTILEIVQSVGDLESLKTSAKGNLVEAVNELAINFNNGTVVSENADFAEVGEWSDGNPNNEDRIGYFVSVYTSEPGKTMVKATSSSDVRGVTMLHPAFAGNASADKYDSDGNLLKQYDYVGFAGFVPVIDNGTCEVNGRCMPADDGTAVPSSNNLGYHVIERIDSTHVLVLVEPQADMMVRIKEDISQLSEEMESVADEVDAVVSLAECGILTPVYQDGTFYADDNGFIYTL